MENKNNVVSLDAYKRIRQRQITKEKIREDNESVDIQSLMELTAKEVFDELFGNEEILQKELEKRCVRREDGESDYV